MSQIRSIFHQYLRRIKNKEKVCVIDFLLAKKYKTSVNFFVKVFGGCHKVIQHRTMKK